MLREMDYRESDNGTLEVRLLWDDRTCDVLLELSDRRLGSVAMTTVDPRFARDAFLHPFPYVGRKVVKASL